ncbi:RNA-binding protein [Arachidicoccus ginsenosidimutans]|uniref:RNA recognition motif domain-containing protein n=1 Tax=Arachidicoccus sp. BS20 TaxID=1850526 RepID=UPI0007F0FEF6|nr:RNA-binding protein [Arachidicoccus sp. BS20]ANI90699.1 RNA-binding protein [Arachidicoccus sp. BS20]
MNIYVGNLSWSLTSDDLHELFAPYGEVISAKVVTDKFNNNRSKGFGFVEMADDEAANAAISGLHETEVGGRKIIVNQKQENAGGGDYKKKSYGNGGGYRDRNSGGGYRNNY